MRRFRCTCEAATELFFGNIQCLDCGRLVGFDPERLDMVAVTADEEGLLVADDGQQFRRCANGIEHGVCSWLVSAHEHADLCVSCRLNRTIPSLAKPENLVRWGELEYAKRRLVYSLLALGLDFTERDGQPGLHFSFLEDHRTNPLVLESTVMTGHQSGLVTVNVAEADPAYREREREALNQGYRTVLGHLRHESGHFFFERLITPGPALEPFRGLFGDERASYTAALERFHAAGAPAGWWESHVSEYAAAHPLEDWAECWAHFLHRYDTIETAAAFGFTEPLERQPEIERWLDFTVGLNEVNRSMGQPDAYPFAFGPTAIEKLRFVAGVIESGHGA